MKSTARRDTQTVIVTRTRNAKLGKGVWASTVPVEQTCPRRCALRDQGCYAQRGVGGHNARLEGNARRARAHSLDVARAEAHHIALAALVARKGAPLRLHVGGDCRSPAAASIVSRAAAFWPGPVWTFTHAWRSVPRAAWGGVSVLGSCDRPRDGLLAIGAGYAPAVVVPELPPSGTAWEEAGVTWVPCPAETRGRTCADCRLCFDAAALIARRHGIAFGVHGSGRARAAAVLVHLRRKHP